MAMLLTSQNLAEIKFKTKRIALEKADAEINVALVNGELVAEGQQIDKGDSEALQEFGLKVLMGAVVDDNGKPVFENKESFESLPLAVQQEIMDAVYDYNGLGKQSSEELEKNLSKTQSGDSTSG